MSPLGMLQPVKKTATSSSTATNNKVRNLLFTLTTTPYKQLAHGTGSKPPGCQGWHRLRRRRPSQPPRRTPYFSIAWYMYSEQEGTKRHDGGSKGEIQSSVEAHQRQRDLLHGLPTGPGSRRARSAEQTHAASCSTGNSASSTPGGHPHQIPTRLDHIPHQAHRLAQPPARPVPLYRLAQPSADRESAAADLTLVGQDAQHRQRMRITGSFLSHLLEALFIGQTVTTLHVQPLGIAA